VSDRKQQNEHPEQEDELRDLDVPEEQVEEVKGGNLSASGSDISPWTTTHGDNRR
jgi:hypothetical protein